MGHETQFFQSFSRVDGEKNGKAHFYKGITLMHLKCNLSLIMDTLFAFGKIFFYVICLKHRASPMQPLAALTGLEILNCLWPQVLHRAFTQLTNFVN